MSALLACLPGGTARAGPEPAPAPVAGSGTAGSLAAQLEHAAPPNNSAEVRATRALVRQLSGQLADAQARTAAAAAELVTVRQRLAAAEAEVRRASAAVARRKAEVVRYAVAVYQSGATPEQQLMLSIAFSRPSDEVLHTAAMLEQVGHLETGALGHLRRDEQRLADAEAEVRQETDRQQQLVAQLADQQSTLSVRLDQAKQHLAEVSGSAGFSVYAESTTPPPPTLSARLASAPVPGLQALLTPLAVITGVTADQARGVAALSPGSSVVRTGLLTLGGHDVQAFAVDPGQFRALTAAPTAQSDPLWRSIAAGELAVSDRAGVDDGFTLGQTFAAGPAPGVPLRLSAFASTDLPGADAVLSMQPTMQPANRTDALGLTGYAVVLAASGADPGGLLARARSLAGPAATVTPARGGPDRTAFLSGGSAAARFGRFSYTYLPDGSIQPDPGWVAANIRTRRVPILGPVTCHRLMFPQLIGALTQIEDSGLAGAIHPDEYGGCYVPRFIASDPAKAMSLHTWGIAIDLNVPENQRGTAGAMDPRVVAIFKQWGFRWGGDWSYTDPMHFELGALLR